MFISNFEKSKIDARLGILEAKIEQLGRSLNALHDAKSLAPQPGQLKPSTAKPAKKKSAWTMEKRLQKSEQMKKMWVDKKAQATAKTKE